MPPLDEKQMVEHAANGWETATCLKRNLQSLRIRSDPGTPLRALVIGVREQGVEPQADAHDPSACSTVITRTGPRLSARIGASMARRSPTTSTSIHPG